MTAFAFLCAVVVFIAAALTHHAALASFALWTALIAFGALLPPRHVRQVLVVVRPRSDTEDLNALPTAAAGSYPTEENI